MSKDLFAKYIWEVSTIINSGGLTFRELNERWRLSRFYDGSDIPRRTFCNHRSAIEDLFNISIECDKSTNKYYIPDSFDVEDNKMQHWMVNRFSINNMLEDSQAIKDKIVLDSVPHGVHHLMSLIHALRENRLVKLSYKAFNRKRPIVYILKPLALRMFNGKWHLLASSLEGYDTVFTYSLSRVHSTEILDETFEYPKDFSVREYFKYSYGMVTSDEVPAQKVVIRVGHMQQTYIESQPLHESQRLVKREKDYSTFELFVCPTYDFIQTLLSYGADLEVLEPTALRDVIKEKVLAMYKMYNLKEGSKNG